jgi:large subunit ribosomal protein L4
MFNNMKVKLLNLNNQSVGEIILASSIFGLEARIDIIKRVIDWQRSRLMQGTHSVKSVGDVSGTTRKPFKQKGTGNARQGNSRGVQRRGGGVAHGPQLRSHAQKLQKKVRLLGLKHALSVKLFKNQLYCVDSIVMSSPKTANVDRLLSGFGRGRFFIIDGCVVDNNFKLSVSSLHNVSVVPAIGANVYDIINSDYVLISKDGLSVLNKRLK